MVTKRNRIKYLNSKISKLEVEYTNSKNPDILDKLVKARRELLVVSGGSLSGSIYTDIHKSRKNTGVRKLS